MSTPPLPAGMQDTLLNNVANQLHSIAVHVLRRARIADRETGLTPERLSLLSVLAFSGPKSISELAAIEGVSLPAITRIVNFLEELGLVARDRKSDDGRVVRVTTTKRGLKLMEDGRRRRVERVAIELEDLDYLAMRVVAEAVRVLADIDGKQAKAAPGSTAGR